MRHSIDHGVNPFKSWAKVTDCGDISNTPFDKMYAIQELEHGMKTINSMKPKNKTAGDAVRLITIGGDHTISKFSYQDSTQNTNHPDQHYQYSERFTQLGDR